MGKMHVSQLKFEIAALSELLKTPEIGVFCCFMSSAANEREMTCIFSEYQL